MILGWAINAQWISGCIQRQIHARRALCSAPVLPCSGRRGEEQGAFEKLFGQTSTLVSGLWQRDDAPGQLYLGRLQTVLNPEDSRECDVFGGSCA